MAARDPLGATPATVPEAPARRMHALRAVRLSRRAKRGDEGAFEEIFRSHHQELYRYCLAILRDRDDAEDALQATMAAALRSLPGEERHVEIRPWLFRVAHNEAISLLRKRRASVPADAELVDRTAVSQEAELATRERLRSLVADLGELPERQRSAIVMRELTGLSYGEIGAALSCSEGGARQAVYEARTSLRDREEGRAMECEHVRKAISDRDGRRLRGRKLRAHLDGCDGCRGFAASISQRRLDFEALCPPLPAAAAGAMLAGMIGGSGGATAGGAAVAGGTAAAGTGLAASAAVKGASVAAAVALAAGAADVGGLIDLPNPVAGGKSEPASSTPAEASGSAGAGQAAGSAGDGGSTITSSRRSQPGESGNAGDEAAAGSGRGDGAGAQRRHPQHRQHRQQHRLRLGRRQRLGSGDDTHDRLRRQLRDRPRAHRLEPRRRHDLGSGADRHDARQCEQRARPDRLERQLRIGSRPDRLHPGGDRHCRFVQRRRWTEGR